MHERGHMVSGLNHLQMLQIYPKLFLLWYWFVVLYECGYTMITMTHGRENPVHSRYLAVTFLGGATESSHCSPARVGYGRPLWIQILPRGRLMLNILLQSSATYRESVVVRSQHNSRVAI